MAKLLVSHKFSACVNIVPNIQSVYYWNEEIKIDDEYALIIKTVGDKVAAIFDFIKLHHEYDTPCIFSIKFDDIEKNYGKWIANCLNSDINDEQS